MAASNGHRRRFGFEVSTVASPSRAQLTRIRVPCTLKRIDEEDELETPPVTYGQRREEGVFLIHYYLEFKKMVAEIKMQKAVGVLLGGWWVSRIGEVHWALFATETKIFQVDVKGLEDQHHNPWEILGNEIFSNRDLIKVFHDCRPASDFLMNSQNIVLRNVFDTQVADVIIIKNTTGKCKMQRNSLSDCIEFYHLEVPADNICYLRVYEKRILLNFSKWIRRPIPSKKFMVFGSLQVKYLLELREVQVKKMMEKFSKCVDECLFVAHDILIEKSEWFFDPDMVSSDIVEIVDGPRPRARSNSF